MKHVTLYFKATNNLMKDESFKGLIEYLQSSVGVEEFNVSVDWKEVDPTTLEPLPSNTVLD